MFCTSCGAKLEENAAFCSACGAKVEAPPVAAKQPSPADPTTPLSASAADPFKVQGTPVPPAETISMDNTPFVPEKPVDMSHAFDPQPAPFPASGNTKEMPVVTPPTPPARYDATPAAANSGKKTPIGLIIGIIAAVLALLVAGALAYFFLFAPKTVTVSYETAGGSTVAPIELDAGDAINSPANPVKDGYVFEGWFADPQFSIPVTFPYVANEDVTLYAKWTEMTAPSSGSAGDTATTYTNSDTAVNALKGYYSTVQSLSGDISSFADEFNSGYNKAGRIDALINRASQIEDSIFSQLRAGDSGQWKVQTMAVPSNLAGTRDNLAAISDTLLSRIGAMKGALFAIQSMYDPSSSEIDAAISSYMQDSSAAKKKYDELKKKIDQDLS